MAKEAMALGEKPGAGSKTDDSVSAIADALEIAFGKRPTDEQVEAFCLASALAVEKHTAGEY